MLHLLRNIQTREGEYSLYHSITFGDKNTWDDWKLVPSSRPLFNPPAPKVKTIEIPGGDGIIDLSQSLTGYPVYDNRKGSFEFYVMNDYRPWQIAYSDIMDYLHGQTMKATLEDDPEFFYEGRFSVNAWKSEKDYSKIVIDYDVGPYKWENISSIDDWLWNPFNFQNGIIKSSLCKDIAISDEIKTVIFTPDLCGRAPVCPKFIVNCDEQRGVHIHFVNSSIGLDTTLLFTNGINRNPEIVFFGDNNSLIELWCDSGREATVSIEFHAGRL